MSTTMTGTPKLNAALAKAQAVFEAAEKSALNPAFKDANNKAKKDGTKYADLSSVVAATRPALTSNGLAVTQEPLEAPEGWVKVRTVLLHESGEERSSVLMLPCTQKTPQAYGSAITYARRYSYSSMVGVVADEDDDGNAASGKTEAPKQSAVKSKEQPKSEPLSADAMAKEKGVLLGLFETTSTDDEMKKLWPRVEAFKGAPDYAELEAAFRAGRARAQKAVKP